MEIEDIIDFNPFHKIILKYKKEPLKLPKNNTTKLHSGYAHLRIQTTFYCCYQTSERSNAKKHRCS